jgi:hypothetical protein
MGGHWKYFIMDRKRLSGMAEQGAEKLKYVPQRLNPSLKATPLTQRWKRRSTPNQSFSAGAEAVPYPKPIYETSDSLCILQSSVVVQYEHLSKIVIPRRRGIARGLP